MKYKKKNKYEEYIEKIVQEIKVNFVLYFLFQYFLNFFIIYYLTIFCALYHYSQKELFRTYLVGELLSFLLTIGISLIISLLRYFSIVYKNKNMYYTSMFIDHQLSNL